MRSRGWIIVVNNWTVEDYADVTDLYETHEATYLVVGFEVGEQGTPHLQCYVNFKNDTSFKTLKKLVPRGHFEKKVEKSTPKQASDYCKEDGLWIEFGELPAKGKLSAKKIEGIMLDPTKNVHLFMQYRKAWQEYKAAVVPDKKDRKMEWIDINDVDKVIHEQMYDFNVTCFNTQDYDSDSLTYYNDEMLVFIQPYERHLFQSWEKNRPRRHKYGYVLKYIDPKRVIIIVDQNNQDNLLENITSTYNRFIM